MSQRGMTSMAASVCWPAASRSAPAKAIIAPLSVHSAGRGKQTRPPRRTAIWCSFSQALVGTDATGHDQGVAAGRVVGHLSRTVVFGLIGYFLINAAVDYKPKESVGLDGALSALAQASYGPVLLGIVAAGPIAFGNIRWPTARYRRV